MADGKINSKLEGFGALPVGGADEAARILAALKDQRFTWRTAKGVAADTKIDEARVRQILWSMSDEVVIPEFRTPNGDQLYASRTHLLEKSGAMNLISGSFRNRIY